MSYPLCSLGFHTWIMQYSVVQVQVNVGNDELTAALFPHLLAPNQWHHSCPEAHINKLNK